MLLSCVIATLTPQILPHVIGAKHTSELRSKLEIKFSLLSRTHIQDLKNHLYSLKKTTSMDQYLDHIKGILLKLEASGSHIDDEELVFHTLHGLGGGEYRTFKQAIRTRAQTTPLTFNGLCSMIMTEDLCLDSKQIDPSTILMAQHSGVSASTGTTQSPNPFHAVPSQSITQPQQYQFPIPFGSQLPPYGSETSQTSNFG